MIPAMSLIEDQMSFYNIRRSGSSYNAATILSAISDLGDIECVAYLSKGLEDSQTIWTIDQNVTVPENISILVPCGVILQVNTDITITFEGPLFNQCPIWRIGLGQVVLKQKTAINSQSYSDFFDPFVVSGGIHGLSPTCFSPNFHTEAYVANGQYLYEESQSINYGALGANCEEDVVWVVINNLTSATIPGTNFIRVPGTHYYIDFTSTSRPVLPPDSAYLMELFLQDDKIIQVNDLRAFDGAQGLLNRIPLRSWTPELSPGIYNYTERVGTFLNLGRLVYVTCYIQVASVVSYGTGVLGVRNLPFYYSIMSGAASGGFTFHIAENIRAEFGPGSFSGFITSDPKEMYIAENIVGRPYTLVTPNRVLPNMRIYFTGIYLLF